MTGAESGFLGLRRKLRRVQSLSRGQWRALAEAWVELLRADAVVSALPYRWWREQLATEPADRSADAGDAGGAGDAGDAGEEHGCSGLSPRVDPELLRMFSIAAANHMRPMSCLRKALALRRMLRRRAVDSHMRFGARRAGGAWDAHVWLMVDGRPVELDDAVRVRYAEMSH